MKSDLRSHRRRQLALTLVLLFLSQVLSGCMLLMVGGAAGGGYYVGTDERSFGRIIDDASITSSVKSKFIRDPDVDALDINVDTLNSVVTLHGHVPSKKIANRATVLARSVRGVTAVKSKLAVVASP